MIKRLVVLLLVVLAYVANAAVLRTHERLAPKVGEKDDDTKGSIIIDCVKDVKCENTLGNIQKCMKKATEAGLTPSAEEISKEFSTCAKERVAALSAKGGDAPEYGPNRKMPNVTVRVDDDFQNARNSTHFNQKFWEDMPENEEHRVLQTDSVGVSIGNFKWIDTEPDVDLAMKASAACRGTPTKEDLLSKQRSVFECKQWCAAKGNEDLDREVTKRLFNDTAFGCEFVVDDRRGPKKENCFLRSQCHLEKAPKEGYAARFEKKWPEKNLGSSSFQHGSKKRNSVVFGGNSHNVSGGGKSMDATGHRALVSKVFDFSDGGVISFWLKDGPDNGGDKCLRDYTEMKKRFEAAAARKKEEENRRDTCQNRGPEGKGCSGHGSGRYTSSCNSEWWCDTNHSRPFNPTCTCSCNSGWVGKRCEVRYETGYCRSVGDPHPNTADGLYYNVYDAGEFKYFEHPDSKTTVHALFRMAHPRISATSAVAVRVCENTNSDPAGLGKCDIISFEAPNCRYSNYKISVTEDGKCHGGSQKSPGKLADSPSSKDIGTNFWGKHYTTKNTKVRYDAQWNIYAPDGSRMYVPGYWRYGWHHHKHGAGGCSKNGGCRSWNGCGNWGGYLNAYLYMKAPRDGRTVGVCGNFGSNRGRDVNELINTKGHRHHTQWSTTFRDSVTVKAADSFFKCGDVYDYAYTYSPYKFKSMRANQMVSVAQRMSMATEALAAEFAEDKLLNKQAGDAPDKLSQKKAEEKCKHKNAKSGGEAMTEEALANCVQDMMLTNDDAVRKNAIQESSQEIELAFEEAKADEADALQELAAERKLFQPGPSDLVLQYCNNDCEAERNWKQLRAFPAKIYTGFTDEWKEFTAKIVDDAKRKGVRFRFYQKKHSCYCCDVFGVDDVRVQTGGWPVRIIADKSFTLFADGKKVGGGEWYEAAKDTYRYRVDPKTRVFGVKIEGADEGRMGVIGSFGDSLVTSSSWKCKSNLNAKEIATFATKDFDASLWASAFEEGQNGILPWGERPGIAKSAFWIFDSQAYKMKSATTYCRVDSDDAWHSYDKEHLAASRWSCKSMQNRQSPYVVRLDSNRMSMVNIASGDDARSHFAPKVVISSKREFDTQQAILLRVKVRQIMEKTVVGEQIKQAVLRLMITDATERPIKVCRNTAMYSAATVTYDTRPAYDKDTCISVTATKENEWAPIDITEWMRDWVTDAATANFGITILGQSRDIVTFASHLNADANMRPRLSLSCHGDRVPAELVFKEKKVTLVPKTKAHHVKVTAVHVMAEHKAQAMHLKAK